MFPELPVPKAGENVDKVQQYTDDFAETKKRLEEARQRRLDEKRRQASLPYPRKNFMRW